MSPGKVKYGSNRIPDHDDPRDKFMQIMEGYNGPKIGGPGKVVKLIIDLVREEGAAEGKALPETLPLGRDSLAVMRNKAVSNLALCNEWEDVIRSTNLE